MRQLSLIIAISAVILLMSSCDNAKRYKLEIDRLEASVASADSAAVVYNQLPLDSLQRLFKKVKNDMALVQSTFEGEMNKDLGVTLSRYRDIPNNIKNLAQLRGQVNKELELSSKQLIQLKEAILSGANKDSKGNSIDENYIKKNTELETKVVNNLVQQIQRMQSGSEKAMAEYTKYYPMLKPTLDSLQSIAKDKP